MDVRVLEYLIMIEQEKSISGAAQRAHVSQSALSQCLAKAETELGSPLFVRVNRQMKPTRIGEIYLKGAREMLEIKEDVYQKIRNLESSGARSIRLAVDCQVYQKLVQSVIPVLKEEYPEVQLKLLTADSLTVRQYLTEQIVDGGILCGRENSSSMLTLRPLFREQLTAVYPYEKRGEQQPFVYPQRGTYFRPVFEKILSEMQLDPGFYYEAADFEQMKKLVQQGYGFTFLPENMAEGDPAVYTEPLKKRYEYIIFFGIPRYSESNPVLERLYELTKENDEYAF